MSTLDRPVSYSFVSLQLMHLHKPMEPEILGEEIKFVRNGLLVRACVEPYYIPYGLSDNPTVKEVVIDPAVRLVSQHLATIDDLIVQLNEFAGQGIINPWLMYSIEGKNRKWFEVSDGTHEKGDLFNKLRRFKGQDKQLLNPAYLDFFEAAGWLAELGEDEGNYFNGVEGNTLREAVERALAIYRMADRLKTVK